MLLYLLPYVMVNKVPCVYYKFYGNLSR